MRLRALLVVIASLFFAAPAAAEETRWYGWQTLAVDGAATAIIVTSLSGQDGSSALNLGTGSGKTILGIGIGTYALGGAAVHVAHGQPLKALASVGVRAVAPLAMTGTGMLVAIPACGGGGYCALAGAFFGVIAGAFVGSVVDAAALAHEPTRPAKPASRISVGFAPTRGGATAGISGAF